MPERRSNRILRLLLPDAIVRNAFAPAHRELEGEWLQRRTQARSITGRVLARLVFHAQVVLLFLDCWRIALGDVLLPRREARIQPPGTGKGAAMFTQSLRHSFRRLLREPAFTWTAVLTLFISGFSLPAAIAIVVWLIYFIRERRKAAGKPLLLSDEQLTSLIDILNRLSNEKKAERSEK